jgi:hypothetical protein
MDKNTFCSIMLASKSSYKFLGAPDGFWLGVTDDGVEKMYSFDEMPEEYKKNCIKYLEDQRKNIEKGFFINGINMNKLNLTDSDIEDLSKFATEAVDEKINQFRANLKKRY